MSAHHRPRAWEYRAGPLVVALVFSLGASCTSEPERRDLPDVDIDVSADPTIDAPSDGPAPTVQLRHGDTCVVEAQVYPAGSGASTLQPGPYTFANATEATAFVTEAVEALMYLGCDITAD